MRVAYTSCVYCLRTSYKKSKAGYDPHDPVLLLNTSPPEPVEDIVKRITTLETEIAASLKTLFHEEG